MDINAILQVAMRYLHLVSVTAVVGGLAFISFSLQPGLRLVDDNFRQTLLRTIQHKFQRVLLLGIAGLILSGTYNWMTFNATYTAMKATVGGGRVPIGQILIGTKVLLAVMMFSVTFARATGLLTNAHRWHKFNLHLAAVIMLLAGILHYLRIEHLKTLAVGH